MIQRFMVLVVLGILGACTPEPIEPQVVADVPEPEIQSVPFDIPPGECWWCVDAEGFFDLSVSTVVSDEGQLNPDGDKTIWWGDVDLTTGQGVFGFTRENADELNCSAYYSVVSSVSGPLCDDCSFSWVLTLGEGVIAEDTGGCKPALRLNGTKVSYGHGQDIVFRDYGHTLYLDTGDGWQDVGISILENESRWTFFHDVVEEGVK